VLKLVLDGTPDVSELLLESHMLSPELFLQVPRKKLMPHFLAIFLQSLKHLLALIFVLLNLYVSGLIDSVTVFFCFIDGLDQLLQIVEVLLCVGATLLWVLTFHPFANLLPLTT